MNSTEKKHTPLNADPRTVNAEGAALKAECRTANAEGGAHHQPSALIVQRSKDHTPSLFPDEWHERFDPELERLMADADSADHNALYARFVRTHPPLFQGVYSSPSIALGGELTHYPHLSTDDNQIWIEVWGEPGPEPVLEVIPIAHHRLVALVLRHELLIIRAHEYEHVRRTLNADRRAAPSSSA